MVAKEYIKYTGVATVRRITKEQWKEAGVAGQADLVWNIGNDWRVSKDDVKPAALAILEADGDFASVNAKGAPTKTMKSTGDPHVVEPPIIGTPGGGTVGATGPTTAGTGSTGNPSTTGTGSTGSTGGTGGTGGTGSTGGTR